MKTALLNICIVAVGISLLKMLIPNNRFNKQINFLVSCFFIVSIITAFSNEKFDIKFFSESPDVSYVDFSEQTTEERKQRIADEISTRVKNVLAIDGINPKEIYVIVNISDYYSISINEIKLVLSVDDDYQKATDVVLREVGDEIKVNIEIA